MKYVNEFHVLGQEKNEFETSVMVHLFASDSN